MRANSFIGSAVSLKKKPTGWLTNPDGSLVDWRDEDQVRAKVVAQWDENWNHPSDYIESRVLSWIRELEQIGAIALEGNSEEGPDYGLAARISLSPIKVSSLNRRRVDLSAQVAMTSDRIYPASRRPNSEPSNWATTSS